MENGSECHIYRMRKRTFDSRVFDNFDFINNKTNTGNTK